MSYKNIHLVEGKKSKLQLLDLDFLMGSKFPKHSIRDRFQFVLVKGIKPMMSNGKIEYTKLLDQICHNVSRRSNVRKEIIREYLKRRDVKKEIKEYMKTYVCDENGNKRDEDVLRLIKKHEDKCVEHFCVMQALYFEINGVLRQAKIEQPGQSDVQSSEFSSALQTSILG